MDVRFGRVSLGIALLGLAFYCGSSHGQIPKEHDLARVLGVQRALGEGRDALNKGDFAGAVSALERQLGNIQGDQEYLNLLRQAYLGHANALRQAGNNAELETYQRRLRILENGLGKPESSDLGSDKGTASGVTLPAPPAVSQKEPEAASSLAKRLSQSAPKVEITSAVSVSSGLDSPSMASNSTNLKNTQFRGNLDDQPRVGKALSESNPFAWENSEDYHQVRLVLDKAEKAFAKADYGTALDLYTQAWQKQPKLPQATKEKWAYCRLHALTEKANKLTGTPGFSEEFAREAAQVKALTNKFDNYLSQVGTAIGQGGANAKNSQSVSAASSRLNSINVSHDANLVLGWYVVQTSHFRVFHKLDKPSAERVAQIAELTRTIQGERWFGAGAITWETKCDLYVHATGADYSQATGVPPSSPGHSTVKVEGGRISHRRIDLHSDDPNMLEGVLPHETTHVVLAGNLGSGLVPRWADEGMSVLSEPQDRIEKHTRQMVKHHQDGTLFPVRQLLELRDYPEHNRVPVFYAQSVSVVQYLTGLKGHQVFAAFLREGMLSGYDQALRKHYGIQDWQVLDQAWRNHAVQGQAVASR